MKTCKQVNTYNDLVNAVAKLEGLKVSIPIAQIREVLTCLSDLAHAGHPVCTILTKNGRKRHTRGVSKKGLVDF